MSQQAFRIRLAPPTGPVLYFLPSAGGNRRAFATEDPKLAKVYDRETTAIAKRTRLWRILPTTWDVSVEPCSAVTP